MCNNSFQTICKNKPQNSNEDIEKEKKKTSTAVFQREYIIYKFKIQALPSYAWSSFKILTIKSLR